MENGKFAWLGSKFNRAGNVISQEMTGDALGETQTLNKEDH